MQRLSRKTIEKRKREAEMAKQQQEGFASEVQHIQKRREALVMARKVGGLPEGHPAHGVLKMAYEAEMKADPEETRQLLNVAANRAIVQMGSLLPVRKPSPSPGSPAAKRLHDAAIAKAKMKAEGKYD